MSKSEIFDEYAKLALKKGLIKNAEEPKETKQLKDYKHDSYPRAGSDSISVIEALYGVKPDMPESMKYEHNIMEDAHPNQVIIAPSYDKLNGLVENNNERQRIMINIVRKRNDGHLTQRKYAETELLMSLVRTANDMDNKDAEQLRVLADTCIEQLQKKSLEKIGFEFGDILDKLKDVGTVGKGAGVGAIAGGLIGLFGGPGGALLGAEIGGALGGAISAIAATAPQAIGVAKNAEVARDALAPLISQHASDVLLNKLNQSLSEIIGTAQRYSDVVDKMHMPDANDADKKTAEQIGSVYVNSLVKLDQIIDAFLFDAKQGKYAPQESDWWSKVKSPFQALLGSEISKAIGAMETLESVSKNAIDGIQQAKSAASSIPASSSQPIATLPGSPSVKEPGLTDYLSKMFELGK